MMRLILIACVLLAGSVAAEEPATFEEPMVLFIDCIDPEVILKLVCEEGPYEITFSEMAPCPPSPPPKPYRKMDGTYSRGITTSHLLVCYSTHTETWSDWPECGGREMTAAHPNT